MAPKADKMQSGVPLTIAAGPFENGSFDASIMVRADRFVEDPLVVFQPNGDIVSFNPSWQRLYSASGPLIRNVYERLNPEHSVKLKQTIERVMEGSAVTIGEFDHEDGRGGVTCHAWTIRYDRASNVLHCLGVNMSQRRRQHETFEAINRKVAQQTGKALFESMAVELAKTFSLERVGISRIDGDDFQTIGFADQAGKRADVRYPISGSVCENVLNWGTVRLTINPVDEIPPVWELQPEQTTAYVGSPVFSLDRTQTVGLIWTVSHRPMDDLPLLEWLLLSFSVRVAAEMQRISKEEELAKQLAYNQAILRASPDLLFVLSEDFVYRDFICRSVDQLRVSPENIIGRKMKDLLPHDVCESFMAATYHSKKTGEVSMITYDLDTLGGQLQSFEARILVNRDRTSLQFVRNVTAEKNLRMEQSRLNSILEASPDICAILGMDGQLNYLNPAGRKFFGWVDGEAVGAGWVEHVLPENSVRLFYDNCAPAALREGSWRGEVVYCDLDGREVPFSQLVVAHTSSATSTGYYSLVLRDMSDRRDYESKIEEQQLQIMSSAKMAALGEMAAGIAHEINNPLASIMARAQVLGEMAHERPQMALERMCEFTDKISQMSERIARIIRSLRSFARDGEMDPLEPRPLRELIDETLELCRARFRSQDVKIEVKLDSDSLVIWSRPVQISQVLLNLLSNSFDALTRLTDRWVVIEARRTETGVELTVTDSGCGIEEAIAAKIMLPFFTTKEVGSGTGLGLSISSGIVQSHGGDLYLDRSSANTRFVVSLPQSVEGPSVGAGVPPLAHSISTN